MLILLGTCRRRDRARRVQRIPLAPLRPARGRGARRSRIGLLSALYLDTDAPSPFARALVADAVLTGGRLVAEGRGPRASSGRAAGAGARDAGAGRGGAVSRSLARRPGPRGGAQSQSAARRSPPGRSTPSARWRAQQQPRRRPGSATRGWRRWRPDFDRALRQSSPAGTLSDPASLDLPARAGGARGRSAGAGSRQRDGSSGRRQPLGHWRRSAETRAAGQAAGKNRGRATATTSRASAALAAPARRLIPSKRRARWRRRLRSWLARRARRVRPTTGPTRGTGPDAFHATIRARRARLHRPRATAAIPNHGTWNSSGAISTTPHRPAAPALQAVGNAPRSEGAIWRSSADKGARETHCNGFSAPPSSSAPASAAASSATATRRPCAASGAPQRGRERRRPRA